MGDTVGLFVGDGVITTVGEGVGATEVGDTVGLFVGDTVAIVGENVGLSV